MLVLSAVQEGKAVSSSASVEVASMSSIAAAQGPFYQTITSDEDNSYELLEAEANLDYLCNMAPHRYEAVYGKMLSHSMLGEAFVSKYIDDGDSMTAIDPKCSYNVKEATKHPIYENYRVKAFKALLTSSISDDRLISLRELMYQFKIVSTENCAVYRAKITGVGSGGTICILTRNCILGSQQILEMQRRYKVATRYMSFLFEGSSPGAGKFGYLKIRLASATKYAPR